MTKQSIIATVILSSAILASCSSQEGAPIVYGSNPAEGRNTGRIHVSTVQGSPSTSPQITRKTVEKPIYNEPQPTGYLKDPSALQHKINYTSEDTEPKHGDTLSVSRLESNTLITEDNLDDELDLVLKQEDDTKAASKTITADRKAKVLATLDVKQQKSNNLSDVATLKSTETDSADEESIAPNLIKPVETGTQTSEAITFQRPVAGPIIAKFGTLPSGTKSNGINIEALAGTPVVAAREGEVIHTGNDPKFGNLIIIKHTIGDLFSAYAHLESVNVRKGAQVSQGMVIGKVGQTGNINKPQLHFAIREGKTPVNPLKYFDN